MREVDVDLAARTAGAGVGHLPEVVGRAEPVDAAVGKAGDLLPEGAPLLVFVKHADSEVLFRNAEIALGNGSGDELPGKGDGIALEVVAEREVAEHLEKRVVTIGMTDLLKVVVLAAGSHAFLACRGAAVVVWRRFNAEEDALELHHAGVREQQRGIVTWHER